MEIYAWLKLLGGGAGGGGSVVPPKKGPLFVVLSEYANQSHNFTNLDFCDVTPLFAIGNRTIPHPPPRPQKKIGSVKSF